MKKENIKQLIQKFFKENLKQWPENANKEAAEIVATAFWSSRLGQEIERDTEAGVTPGDYMSWCREMINN